MAAETALDSVEVSYVADMLRAVYLSRYDLGPLPDNILNKLAKDLTAAEKTLRECAEKME